MKIGLNLDNRGPQATPENMIRFAVTADRLGFSSLGVSDHIVLVRQQTRNYPYSATGEIDLEAWTPWNDTLGLIGFVAGKTERIRIGPSVLILPYRNPLVTAKWFATVDALSGGRLFLGAGTGWWREEFEALGLGDQFAERGARTDEYLRIFANLWSEEVPAFAGRYFNYENLIASPKPAQKGGIPIWIGGNTGRALRRVAEFGDVWHPVVLTPPAELNPLELGERRELLEKLCGERGRDPASITITPKTHLHFTEDRTRPMSGRPGQIVEDLLSYREQGADEFIVYTPGESEAEKLENLHRISEEIMPHIS
ncbi:MAG: LLM class F420-dependent oxidoreductase [SAR324 cluster bacterium]|nr:LLM class F420-dependent oxidoreductase [SAR324 cluster bacterium]MCZ6730813.1 LLM class F420-dependent oxidoreductase [SAR324 cluster bacterium]